MVWNRDMGWYIDALDGEWFSNHHLLARESHCHPGAECAELLSKPDAGDLLQWRAFSASCCAHWRCQCERAYASRKRCKHHTLACARWLREAMRYKGAEKHRFEVSEHCNAKCHSHMIIWPEIKLFHNMAISQKTQSL